MMDDKEQALMLMTSQTSVDGLEDWEPTFDDEGSMILDERPTPNAAFRALLRIATELKRLVECAPVTDNGIQVNNQNAFRMTMHKLRVVGTVANSTQYRLEHSDNPGPGVFTSIWTPTYSGSSVSSIVNDISKLPFGVTLQNRRELDRESIELFLRRHEALRDFVSTLSAPSAAVPSEHDDLNPAIIQPPVPLIQLQPKEIGVLEWLGQTHRRNRVWKRAEVLPDNPSVPTDIKEIRAILQVLHDYALVNAPPKKSVRITALGLRWLSENLPLADGLPSHTRQ